MMSAATYGKKRGSTSSLGTWRIAPVNDFYSDEEELSIGLDHHEKKGEQPVSHGKLSFTRGLGKGEEEVHERKNSTSSSTEKKRNGQSSAHRQQKVRKGKEALELSEESSDSSSLSDSSPSATIEDLNDSEGRKKRRRLESFTHSPDNPSSYRPPRTKVTSKDRSKFPVSPRKIYNTRQVSRISSLAPSSRSEPQSADHQGKKLHHGAEEEGNSEDESSLSSCSGYQSPRPQPMGIAARMATRSLDVHKISSLQEIGAEEDTDEDELTSQQQSLDASEQTSQQSTIQSGIQPLLGTLAPAVDYTGRTYGKERSFLAPLNDTSKTIDRLEASRLFPSEKPQKSYNDIRNRLGEAIDSGTEDESDGDELRNVIALRMAGESRRFREEFEYLTSGLSPHQTIEVRIAGAWSLARLCMSDETADSDINNPYAENSGSGDEGACSFSSHSKSSFVDLLSASGKVKDLLLLLQKAGIGKLPDTKLDCAGVMILAHLLQSQACAEVLLETTTEDLFDMVTHLFYNLMSLWSPFSQGAASKKEIGPTNEQCERSTKESTAVLGEIASGPPTREHCSILQNLLLRGLYSLTKLRWLETKVQVGLSQMIDHFDRRPCSILDMVIRSTFKNRERGEDSKRYFENVSISAQLLDFCFTGTNRKPDLVGAAEYPGDDKTKRWRAWAESFATMLGTLLEPFISEAEEAAGSALILVLRMLVNLTQMHRPWSKRLANTQDMLHNVTRVIFEASADARGLERVMIELRSDAVAFSVGLLTNILEAYPLARYSLRRLKLPRDSGDDNVLLPAESPLRPLGSLLERERLRANESAQSGFLSGCLAVCISLLLDDTEEREEELERDAYEMADARKALQLGLNVGEWKEAKMTLLELLEDFAATHEEMARRHWSTLGPTLCESDAGQRGKEDENGERATHAQVSLVRLLKSRIEKWE